jgi:ribosomal protein S27AE
MAEEKKRIQAYLEQLKNKVETQENYGGEITNEEARMDIRDCPECGAGRAYHKGLTACAYCGFIFMDTKLTDGVNIRKENNS